MIFLFCQRKTLTHNSRTKFLIRTKWTDFALKKNTSTKGKFIYSVKGGLHAWRRWVYEDENYKYLCKKQYSKCLKIDEYVINGLARPGQCLKPERVTFFSSFCHKFLVMTHIKSSINVSSHAIQVSSIAWKSNAIPLDAHVKPKKLCYRSE